MSMIVWRLFGFMLGLAASKTVSTTGEGTVVDILLGTVGAVIGGEMLTLFGGGGATGFNIDTVYSSGTAAIGAITTLMLYHVFLRTRMLWVSARQVFAADRAAGFSLVGKEVFSAKETEK